MNVTTHPIGQWDGICSIDINLQSLTLSELNTIISRSHSCDTSDDHIYSVYHDTIFDEFWGIVKDAKFMIQINHDELTLHAKMQNCCIYSDPISMDYINKEIERR